LSKEEARKLILERGQYIIDSLLPEYNINPQRGSRLGSRYTEETKAKLSEINKGKILSNETKAKQSEAHKGKFHLLVTKAKMSTAKGGEAIFLYDSEGTFINTFCSTREAAKFCDCSHTSIVNYIKNGKLFQGKWILSTTDERF